MSKVRSALTVAGLALFAAPAFAQTAEPAASWTDRVTLGADLRLRTELVQQEAVPDRHQVRQRIRARLMANGKVNDDTMLYTRVSTGPSGGLDPAVGGENVVSGNQTLTGAGTKKEFLLDLAYFDWKAFEGFSLAAGKTPNPFFAAGKSEIMWDSDVTFEGAAVKWGQEFGAVKPFVNLEGAWITENAATADQGLLGAQLGATFKADAFFATAAVADYNFTGLRNNNVVGNIGTGTNPSGRGNTVTNPAAGVTTYDFDYNVFAADLEVGLEVAELPVAVYGTYLNNTLVSANDEGQIYGVKIGKVKDPGTWQVDYNWRTVETDATVGTFTDGDFGGGGTNVRGHRVNVQYQLASNTVAGATWMQAENNIATTARNYQRGQLDFIFNF